MNTNTKPAESSVNIQSLLGIVSRRKWFLIIPLVLAAPLVTLWALSLPNIFEASTTILITPQKVPVDYVRPTITTDIGDRVDIIIKQMLSYDRLGQIIDEFRLYPEMVKDHTREEIFYRMISDITITPEESLTHPEDRSGTKEKVIDSFKLSYRGENPRLVAAVANKLASIFIEENLKEREQLAVGTSDFLSKELEQAKNQLTQQEARIAQYKQQYRGELPSELQANLNKLERLQSAQQALAEAISAEEDRRITLEKAIGEYQAANSAADPARRLQELQAILSNHYASGRTDRHPDIVATKKEIELVRQRMTHSRANPADETLDVGNPAILQTRQELGASKLRVQSLKEDIARVTEMVQKIEKLVAETPKRQEELNTLERDLGIMERQYQDLLSKMQDARMAENLERKQKGEQFRVLNAAQVPTKPIQPDRAKYILFGIFFSFMFGMGLVVLVEVSDHSIRKSADVSSYFEVPVLASIPRVVLDAERARETALRRSMIVAGSIVLVLIAGSLALFIFLRSAIAG
jgi:polysaccharide chain length determinant protein (PEP-CTERM system associated)